MEKNEATKAVRTAKAITNVLAVILLVCGVLTFMGGFIIDSRGVDWSVVISGAYLIGAGLLFFIIKGALSGLEAITHASEIYMEKTQVYDHKTNNHYDTLAAEARYIRELAACEKHEEAKQLLKRIQYHLTLERKDYEARGCDVGYYMRDKEAIVEKLRQELQGQ